MKSGKQNGFDSPGDLAALENTRLSGNRVKEERTKPTVM